MLQLEIYTYSSYKTFCIISMFWVKTKKFSWKIHPVYCVNLLGGQNLGYTVFSTSLVPLSSWIYVILTCVMSSSIWFAVVMKSDIIVLYIYFMVVKHVCQRKNSVCAIC